MNGSVPLTGQQFLNLFNDIKILNDYISSIEDSKKETDGN